MRDRKLMNLSAARAIPPTLELNALARGCNALRIELVILVISRPVMAQLVRHVCMTS